MENTQYKHKLEELMGISPEMHNENIEQVALCWLDIRGVESWKYSPQFWSWFKNQWNANCMEIVHKCGYSLDTVGKLPNMAVNSNGELHYPHYEFVNYAREHQATVLASIYPAKPVCQKIKAK